MRSTWNWKSRFHSKKLLGFLTLLFLLAPIQAFPAGEACDEALTQYVHEHLNPPPHVISEGRFQGASVTVEQTTTRGKAFQHPKLSDEHFSKNEIDFTNAKAHLQIHHQGEVAGSQFNGALLANPDEVEALLRAALPDSIRYDEHGRAELTLTIRTSDGKNIGYTGVLSKEELAQKFPNAQTRAETRDAGGIPAEVDGRRGAWYPETERDPSGKTVVAKNPDGSIKNPHFIFKPDANIAYVPGGEYEASLKTDRVTIVIQKENGHPVIKTVFPGENAPAVPARIPAYKVDTLSLASAESAFWNDHVFVRKLDGSNTPESPKTAVWRRLSADSHSKIEQALADGRISQQALDLFYGEFGTGKGVAVNSESLNKIVKAAFGNKYSGQVTAALDGASLDLASTKTVLDHWDEGTPKEIPVTYKKRTPQGEKTVSEKLDPDLYSSQSKHVLEAKNAPVLSYGMSEESLNELAKLQSALDHHIVNQATVLVDGKIDSRFFSLAEKQAPSVTILQKITLPSGEKFTVPLRKGKNFEIQTLSNPEFSKLSQADQKFLADLRRSIDKGNYANPFADSAAVAKAVNKTEALPETRFKAEALAALKDDQRIEAINAELLRLDAAKDAPRIKSLLEEKNAAKTSLLTNLREQHARDIYSKARSEAFAEARAGGDYRSPGHHQAEKLNRPDYTTDFNEAFAGFIQEMSNIPAKKREVPRYEAEKPQIIARAEKNANEVRAMNAIHNQRELEPGTSEYIAREERKKLGFVNPAGENAPDGIPMDDHHYLMDAVAGEQRDPYLYVSPAGKKINPQVIEGAEFAKMLKNGDSFPVQSTGDYWLDSSKINANDPSLESEAVLTKNKSDSKSPKGSMNDREVLIENLSRLEKMASEREAQFRERGKSMKIATSKKAQAFDAQITEAQQRIKALNERKGKVFADKSLSKDAKKAASQEIETETLATERALANARNGKIKYLIETLGPDSERNLIRPVKENAIADFKLIYAFDNENNLRLYPEGLAPGKTRPSHFQLNGGRDAPVAGQMFIKKVHASDGTARWEITAIDDGSGHFRPNAVNLGFVRKILKERYGIETSKDVRLVHGRAPSIDVEGVSSISPISPMIPVEEPQSVAVSEPQAEHMPAGNKADAGIVLDPKSFQERHLKEPAPDMAEKSNFLGIEVPLDPILKIKTGLEAKLGHELKSRGEAHVTVLRPPELGAILKHFPKDLQAKVIAEINDFAGQQRIEQGSFDILGIGSARELDKKNPNVVKKEAFFLVVDAPRIREFRAKLGLHLMEWAEKNGLHDTAKSLKDKPILTDNYDPHITIGFINNDVFGVSKNASALDSRFQIEAPPAELSELAKFVDEGKGEINSDTMAAMAPKDVQLMKRIETLIQEKNYDELEKEGFSRDPAQLKDQIKEWLKKGCSVK